MSFTKQSYITDCARVLFGLSSFPYCPCHLSLC